MSPAGLGQQICKGHTGSREKFYVLPHQYRKCFDLSDEGDVLKKKKKS
jgi:hypothetical protein